MKPRVLGFVPVYNEEHQIGELMERSRFLLTDGVVDELMVIDDGSTDRTSNILRSYPEYTIMRQPTNQGAGVAIRMAYRHALEKGFDVFVLFAGNGKDSPADVPKVLAPILEGRADYVQGSRFLPGGERGGVPAHRLVSMKLFTLTYSLFLLRWYTDCTNGFRAYRTLILRDPRVNWSQTWLGNTYDMEYYLHYKVAQLGYRVTEVPVAKVYRPAPDGSYTKVRTIDWLTALRPLFLLRLGIKQ
jgi:dolichol-phosphate mannosyltransferase